MQNKYNLDRDYINSVVQNGKNVLKLEINELKKLTDRLDISFAKAVHLLFNCSGKVVVTGIGKSGAIARKIAATLSSTGTPALFLHAAEGLHGDLGAIRHNDVVICISKSGSSEEINDLLPAIKQLGVPIIAMTGNSKSDLAVQCDIMLDIHVDKEACPNDLAPTSSTTVTLALGDALAISLLKERNFTKEDFAVLHPGGSLGKRLRVKVDELMETGSKIGSVSQNATMQQAVIEMARKRGICCILNQDKLVGVVTTGDLNRLVENTEHFFDIPVSSIMNKMPKTIQKGTLAYTAYKKMEQFSVIAMPVTDEQGHIAGIIHLHDIMKAGIL